MPHVRRILPSGGGSDGVFPLDIPNGKVQLANMKQTLDEKNNEQDRRASPLLAGRKGVGFFVTLNPTRLRVVKGAL